MKHNPNEARTPKERVINSGKASSLQSISFIPSINVYWILKDKEVLTGGQGRRNIICKSMTFWKWFYVRGPSWNTYKMWWKHKGPRDWLCLGCQGRHQRRHSYLLNASTNSPCKLTVLKALQGPLIQININPVRELLWHFSRSPDGVKCTQFIW